jgi:hypothetical protein
MRNICPAIANDKNQNRCVSIVSLANQIYKAQTPKSKRHLPGRNSNTGGKKEQGKKENLRVEGRGKSSHPNRSEPESWLHHWRA